MKNINKFHQEKLIKHINDKTIIKTNIKSLILLSIILIFVGLLMLFYIYLLPKIIEKRKKKRLNN